MFHVRKINSLDLPDLQPYRVMRWQQAHRDQGIFVAEGEKVVRRLFKSDFGVASLLIPEKWLAEYEPLLNARHEDIPVFLADKKLLETLIGFSMYQGVLAVGRIPPLPSLDEIIARSTPPRLFVAAENLSNAENMGVLVRNCAAFNAQGLIVGETCTSPFLRRSVRNSMGTIFQMPVLESPNLVQTLQDLRSHGVRCIAAHPREESKALFETDFIGDCCILFGSEGEGISAAALAVCDEAVAIPMPPTVDSLNVGSAAAAFLYEASRQRKIR